MKYNILMLHCLFVLNALYSQYEMPSIQFGGIHNQYTDFQNPYRHYAGYDYPLDTYTVIKYNIINGARTQDFYRPFFWSLIYNKTIHLLGVLPNNDTLIITHDSMPFLKYESYEIEDSTSIKYKPRKPSIKELSPHKCYTGSIILVRRDFKRLMAKYKLSKLYIVYDSRSTLATFMDLFADKNQLSNQQKQKRTYFRRNKHKRENTTRGLSPLDEYLHIEDLFIGRLKVDISEVIAMFATNKI